jgi:hypothetical protein
MTAQTPESKVALRWQVVTSWASATDLIKKRNAGLEGTSEGVMSNMGASVALALLALEFVLILKYAKNTAALMHRTKRLSTSREVVSSRRSSRLSISGLTHEQLQYRTRYTTKRFASHAQYWQFVVRCCRVSTAILDAGSNNPPKSSGKKPGSAELPREITHCNRC